MIAAFDFVPRIAARGVISIVHGARHGQTLLHQAFPDHVAGGLVFESVHALVEIAGGPVGPLPAAFS